MKFAHGLRSPMTSLLLFILAIGLLGTSGFVFAADRTVIGELWSADN